jgi:hypothetical protein
VIAIAESGPAPRGWWARRSIASVLLPLTAFVVLRPESFGLTPNGLDPFFYTGYAINFHDLLRDVADHWYFVSRWSAYYPSFLLTEAFGAVAGRLILRLLLASGMLLSLWHLGRRWRWSPQVELVVGVVAVTLPIFARAFLTDYVEYLVVSLGLVLITQCLEPRRTALRSVAIGVIAALLLIANPATFTVIALPVAAYVLSPLDRVRQVGGRVAGITVGGLATLTFGLLLFRAYGIVDVYRPTVDFLSTHTAFHDPVKSPHPTWLYDFTWLYGPPILVAVVAMVPALRRAVLADRVRLTVFGMLTVQTAWQWSDQFLRDGTSLELSYYWSYICPFFITAIAVIVGVDRGLRWRGVAAFLGVWYVVLARPTWTSVTLPDGWRFLVVVALIVATVLAATRYSFRSNWVILVVFTLLTQVAAPPYSPPAGHPADVSPHYDRIYFNAHSGSTREFGEARWLASQLDSLPDDSQLSFAAMSAGEAIVAIYGAQVTDKVVHPDPVTLKLTRAAVDDLRLRVRPRLVIYGPPEMVERCLRRLKGVAARKLLDATNPGDLHYRLIVLEPKPGANVAWAAAELPSLVGRVNGSTRVASEKVDSPGFVTFGPYQRLGRGNWKATVTYRSSAPVGVDVGRFDVVTRFATDMRGMSEIRGTGGKTRTITIPFSVDDPSLAWEFRTWWNDRGDLTVTHVSVDPRTLRRGQGNVSTAS